MLLWFCTQFQVWGFPHQEFLPHRLGVLQLNSALTLSTQRQRQTPRAQGSVPQDASPSPLPTSATDHKSRWSPVFLTDWL